MQVQIPISRARENLLRMLETADPPPKVIIVTMIEDPRDVRELMDLGASAYIVKSASTEHPVAAVRAAILDRKGKNVVVGMPLTLLEAGEEGAESVLSAREFEILLLAAGGLSNRQIAARVHLAKGTLKRHLSNLPRIGGRLQERGRKDGAIRGVDHHPGRHGRLGRARRGAIGRQGPTRHRPLARASRPPRGPQAAPVG
jgi:FixJ family two-component response regulator